MLGCRGKGGLSCPHLSIDRTIFYDHFTCFKLSEYEVSISYGHYASQIKLYTLSFSFVCLVEEAGGKLSRAVYLAPHLSIDS